MESVYQLHHVTKEHENKNELDKAAKSGFAHVGMSVKHNAENYDFEKGKIAGPQRKMHKVHIDAHNATSHHTGTMYFEVPKEEWEVIFLEDESLNPKEEIEATEEEAAQESEEAAK